MLCWAFASAAVSFAIRRFHAPQHHPGAAPEHGLDVPVHPFHPVGWIDPSYLSSQVLLNALKINDEETRTLPQRNTLPTFHIWELNFGMLGPFLWPLAADGSPSAPETRGIDLACVEGVSVVRSATIFPRPWPAILREGHIIADCEERRERLTKRGWSHRTTHRGGDIIEVAIERNTPQPFGVRAPADVEIRSCTHR